MIVIFAAIFGVLLGIYQARKQGGRGIDMAQWGAGFAIAFALVGVIVTVVIERLV